MSSLTAVRLPSWLDVSTWPLRRTLVAVALVVFSIFAVATSSVSVFFIERSLNNDMDVRLERALTMVSKSASGSPTPVPWRSMTPVGATSSPVRTATGSTPAPPIDDPVQGMTGEMLVLRYDAQGIVQRWVARTRGKSVAFETLTDAQVDTLKEHYRATGVLAGDGQSVSSSVDLDPEHQHDIFRVAGLTTKDGQTFIVGISERQKRAQLDTLRLVNLSIALAGFVWTGLVGSVLIGVSLRPLNRVASIATKVSRMPLSTGEVFVNDRVERQGTDPRTEVGQVGAALNGLLDHMDRAFRARHASETQLRQFVADASHELRTPLASIRGYAELSRREVEPVPPGVRRALDRIESESGRMSSLVEDLLLLARLDAGRPLEYQTVDLTMLAIGCLTDMHANSPEHRWTLDVPDDGGVEVMGDADRLTQVMVNLLGNARSHTPPGTTVTLQLADAGRDVNLRVIDDGPGIPAELLPTVFARFTRGDTSRQRAGKSTGLGLSIVEAVVRAHHGTVQVESEPGRTVFDVVLPKRSPLHDLIDEGIEAAQMVVEVEQGAQWRVASVTAPRPEVRQGANAEERTGAREARTDRPQASRPRHTPRQVP